MPPGNVWDRIKLIQGDITKLSIDAIVNAANERPLPGGGVDGAIRHAGGPELNATCAKLGGCPTGDAVITPGFHLPARFVIHTVGPMYRGGRQEEPALLASCYRRSLEIAAANQIRNIAFPAISTGIYGYPFDDATRIALTTIAEVLKKTSEIDEVMLVFFGERDFAAARRLLQRIQTTETSQHGED